MRTWQDQYTVLQQTLTAIRESTAAGDYRAAAGKCFVLADDAKELSGLLQIEQRRKDK